MRAETIAAAQFWAQSRGPETDAWIRQYQKSTSTRHRGIIAGMVKTLQPATLLEIGCHCGPNLIRLGHEVPALKMIGIDVNAEAVAAGQRWAESQGLADRVQFHVGRVPEATSETEDACADVVLSCYTLAYIAPADLDAVLWEVGRIAAKAVILAEPTGGYAKCAVEGGYSEWGHDYRERAKWIGTLRDMTWSTLPVTPKVDELSAVLVGIRGTTP